MVPCALSDVTRRLVSAQLDYAKPGFSGYPEHPCEGLVHEHSHEERLPAGGLDRSGDAYSRFYGHLAAALGEHQPDQVRAVLGGDKRVLGLRYTAYFHNQGIAYEPVHA